MSAHVHCYNLFAVYRYSILPSSFNLSWLMIDVNEQLGLMENVFVVRDLGVFDRTMSSYAP